MEYIGWFSGGVTSAIACKLMIDTYGKGNCRIIFIDTKNEHEDTYRFMGDCSQWYGLNIEIITSKKHESIQHVWRKYKALNNAKGAVCSSELKRRVREDWQKTNNWDGQVFGFDIDEPKRAKSLKLNHPKTKPLFPLLLHGYSKKDCIEILNKNNIDIPEMYKLGFLNNNCFGTGCVQGGIGYWQKMKKQFPENFNNMADLEHELTDLKGKPVTMLKDQGSNGGLVFLKKHRDYPQIKSINDMKGREPKSLVDCNGLCGVNDLTQNKKELLEINFGE